MGKRSRGGSQKSLRTRYLTVGRTARILGISPSTLRLWENIGLVSPARSSRRYRLYSPDLLEVLKRIKYLRYVKKLSVPGIKEALGKDRPTPAGAEVARGDPHGDDVRSIPSGNQPQQDRRYGGRTHRASRSALRSSRGENGGLDSTIVADVLAARR